MPDENIAKLTNNLFKTLFADINSWHHYDWYVAMLEWAVNENFWFDMFEEFLESDRIKVRKKIIENLNKKIKEYE